MDIKSSNPPPYPEVGYYTPKKRNNKEYRFTLNHLILAIVATFVITSAGFLVCGYFMWPGNSQSYSHSEDNQPFSSVRMSAASHSLTSNIWLNSIICAISIAFLMSRNF